MNERCPTCKAKLHYGELDGRRTLICIEHGEVATLEGCETIQQDVERVWQSDHAPREFKSEKAFQAAVERLARENGWMVYHTYDSRRSEPGFPDLTFCKNNQLFYAELKMPKGMVSQAQKKWIAALGEAGMDVYLWYPADWTRIEEVLG